MQRETRSGWWVMPDLSLNSGQVLLDLARRAIQSFLQTRSVQQGVGIAQENIAYNQELLLERGCFVTLRKERALRGCVGTFEANQPLFQAVMRMAVAAAFEDTRFPPLLPLELDLIRLEISVLGELRKINSFKELQIGKHGVYVKFGRKNGTFLPDVAVEEGWTSEEFVHFCAREKARLAPEELACAEIYLYEVEKIAEKEA